VETLETPEPRAAASLGAEATSSGSTGSRVVAHSVARQIQFVATWYVHVQPVEPATPSPADMPDRRNTQRNGPTGGLLTSNSQPSGMPGHTAGPTISTVTVEPSWVGLSRLTSALVAPVA